LDQVARSSAPLSLIRRRIPAVLAFGLAGAAAGFASGQYTREMYTSTALLLVSPYSLSVLNYEPATLDLSKDKVVIDTQIQLLRSPQTLDSVAQVLLDPSNAASAALKVPTSPAKLREFLASTLSIRRVNAADIIEVSFSAENPDLAAFVANEVVTQYLQGQRELKAAELQRLGDDVEERVAILRESAQAADLEVAKARQAQDLGSDGETQTLSEAIASLEQGIATIEALLKASDPIVARAPLNGTRAALAAALTDLNALKESGEAAGQSDAESRSTLVREAEVKANVHREMLQRLLEIRELSNFVSDDTRLVASAVPSATPSSIPAAVLAVMGFFSFLLFGLLVAATVKTGTQREKDWA
jgi:uncharacterized protein involved in exopolysaccharide biosynthesis